MSSHSAPPAGLSGTLRLVTSQDAYDALIASPPKYDVAAVITQDLFSRTSVQKLRDRCV